jgi:Protein of unknown function (DUF3592)
MQENRIYFHWSGRPNWWVPLAAGIPGILIGLVLLAIAGSQLLQQQGYSSGQCTITAKQLQHEVTTTTNITGNGNTTTTITRTEDVYAPSFEYRVRTADGRTYTADNYDGSDSYTSDRAGQQAIVDRYSIGQSYPCWYNPANPTQAVLVRQLAWALILTGGIFLLVSVFIVTIGMLISTSGSQNGPFKSA